MIQVILMTNKTRIPEAYVICLQIKLEEQIKDPAMSACLLGEKR